MAVVKVKLRRDMTMDGDLTSGIRRVRNYLVLLDSMGENDEADAYYANDGTTAVPAMGTVLGATRLVVSTKSAKRVRGLVWQVTVTYAPAQNSFEQKPPGDDATWNRTMSVRGAQSTEKVNFDRFGKPIRNAVGDVFPAEVARDIYDEEVRLGFSTKNLKPALIYAKRGDVNSDVVSFVFKGVTFTYPAGSLKIGEIAYDATVDKDDGDDVWRVEIMFLVRGSWARQLVQMGYRYKSAPSGPIVDSNVPVYLNSNGTKLADGALAVMLYVEIDPVSEFMPFLRGF